MFVFFSLEKMRFRHESDWNQVWKLSKFMQSKLNYNLNNWSVCFLLFRWLHFYFLGRNSLVLLNSEGWKNPTLLFSTKSNIVFNISDVPLLRKYCWWMQTNKRNKEIKDERNKHRTLNDVHPLLLVRYVQTTTVHYAKGSYDLLKEKCIIMNTGI